MPINTSPRYTYDPAAYAASQASRRSYDEQIAQIDAQIQALQNDRGLAPLGYNFGSGNRIQIEQLYEARNRLAREAPNAHDNAYDPVAANNQTWRDATLGRGDDTMADPKLAAAMDRIEQMASGKDTTYYSQATDQAASASGAQAEMLRNQFAASGIGINDPAAQARLRGVETGRLQANQGALATQNNMAQDAAARLAQMRLQQIQTANQMYSQGAGMAYGQQIPRGNTGTGAQVAGRPYQQHAGPTATGNQAGNWQAPSGGDPYGGSGGTNTQQPGAMPSSGGGNRPSQSQQQSDSPTGWYSGGSDYSGISAASEAAQRRLRQAPGRGAALGDVWSQELGGDDSSWNTWSGPG